MEAVMRRYLPSLSALLAFESAGRHLSFTKAAEDLSITQSGVSRQIGNLEAFLGTRLFERIGSRIVLTDAGSTYLQEVSKSLDHIEQASIDTVRGRKLDEALMVCAHPTLVSRWLTPRLHSFMAAHPGVMIEVSTATQEINFETTRIDVAILRGTGSWKDAVSYELFPEELAVVAAPKLLPPGAILQHLDFDQIPTLQNASRSNLWLTWLRRTGLPHSGAIRGPRLPHSEMLISAAVSGLGLAVVPVQYIEAELARGDLWLPFGPSVATEDSYWLVHSERGSDSPATMQFKSWLLRQNRKSTAPLALG
jgi:LysR family transcriptional regulator, glycine cleavage system transcriptional activator